MEENIRSNRSSRRRTTQKRIEQSYKSPLRYPGGKSRAAKQILKYFPAGLKSVCSPFLGGGSIELLLAHSGIEVSGYDSFEPLTNFWQMLLKEPVKLAKAVRKYHPLTRSRFYQLQKNFTTIKSREKQAAIFYILNRASFSGTTLSGGMSTHHPRFTIKGIKQLARFTQDHLHVEHMDFTQSLAKHQNDFLYLDPPYMSSAKLYGMKGDAHKNFEHETLAAMLKERSNWILSYNDCKQVRKLYRGYKIVPLQWVYGMSSNKKSNELLILSSINLERRKE